MASFTASLFISLKTILHSLFGSISSKYAKCHDIASPSRSGSVAKRTRDADAAAFLSSLILSPLPLIFMYPGSN